MAEITSMVRIGKVSAVNRSALKCRVYFPDMSDIVSDWMYVLQRPDESVTVKPAEGHTHGAYVTAWMPKVNDRVLVLYPYGWNTDGYILGAIP